MSRWMRRSAARAGALALALLLPITAVIGPSQTAAAATGPDRPHDERVGDGRVSGGIRNFSAEPNEKSLWISAEPFCSGVFRSCNAWVEFPGYSQKNVNPRGAAVMLEAEHSCMTVRGVMAHGASTITHRFTGVFAEDKTEQERFFSMVGRR